MNWPTSSPSLLLVLPAYSSAPKRTTSTSTRWTFVVTLAVFLTVFNHLAESTSSATASGWDWTGGKNSIDILDELASVRLNLTGVDVAPGPYSISPALYFTGDNRNIRLSETSYDKVMTLLQSHHDITFMAAVRQEPFNVGTIFSLSQGFTRFLELQSSGRKDEIRLHYTHLGLPRVETFSYQLDDGVWHRLAITVSGGIASLYIDCRRVERRWMTAIPDTSVPESVQTDEQNDSGKLSLWIGQRGDQHFLFKGAMQDVKLVAGSNGHLVQCPSAEAECPTCGEFHSLQSVVARMEKSLQQLTYKLEDAEERLTQLEQCDCPRSCSVNGTVYTDGASWHSDCEVCSCRKGQVTCSPVQCPDTPCRNPVQLPGECCRTCLKQCYFRGSTYDHGERVSPRHCLECQCLNGSMQCRPLDPELHCPALSCPPSEQFTVAGECCKQCPGVDYCASASHVCHARAQCINLQTTYACHCSPGYTGDGKHCSDINECETEGGPEGHRCGANTMCVNTAGSYRCDCLAGYVHPSPSENNTCVEYDECAARVDKCHPTLAVCLNTPGSYQCLCRPGYQGNGIQCEPVCDQPCQNGGLCVAPNQCSCRRGFEGAYCQLDIDECAKNHGAATHLCQPNSECHNMDGWYTCACKPGYRSPQKETFLGALCQDIDECAEGTHSCHGNTQCLNTMGSYECRCPPSNPNCSLGCTTAEGVHQNGETWISHDSPCVSCHCRDGVETCSKLPCHCSSADLDSTAKSGQVSWNQTVDHHPNHDLCCSQCRSSKSKCRHQENADVTYDSGQRWIYQCQSCECLHGETDCWPMECPPVYCSHPVRLPGDCCLRCPDDDPCSAVEDVVSSSGEPLGCHHNGRNYTQGAEWAAGLDGCTNCKCKNGKVCCHFDTGCSSLRLGLGRELTAQPRQLNQHKRHGGTGRIQRASQEGFSPDTVDQKKGGSSVRAKTSSPTTETTARSGSRTTTSQQWRRMSRAARLARSSSADHYSNSSSSSSSNNVKQQRRQSIVPASNSSPSSATKHNSGSSQVPASATESAGAPTTKVVSQQDSGPPHLD